MSDRQINEQIVTGNIQNPPKLFNLTIANNAIETIYFDYRFVRIISISNSTGVQLRFGMTGAPTDVIGAGIGYELETPVRNLQIINNSGGAITISVALSFSRIYDDRLNVSGNVSVINAPGTDLDVTDNTLAALLQNRNALRNGLTDLTNASYAQVNNATTVIVTAVGNVNGVIIRLLHGGANSYAAYAQVGANYLFRRIAGGQDTDGIFMRDIFVPAGLSITLSATGGSSYTTMVYEVL